MLLYKVGIIKGVYQVIGNAYVLVVIGILLAKCLGFFRDIFFASVFGASNLTDIYFQVFSLASLIFTGIGEALSTLIIKNLNKAENLGAEKQKAYVSHFITKTAVTVLLVTGVLYIFSGPLVNLLLPGLSPELYKTAVHTMYIMLPSCLFVIISYIMSGVLQNNKVFFVTSIMSLPYNVIIIGALLFKDISITAVSVVTTIGWFLHIVILLPQFIKKGYSLFGRLKSENKSDGKNREILYIFISSMMFQLVFMIDKASVSQDIGSASTVNYASNLFVTIASVFVVAMSRVSYPSICRHFESGDITQVKSIVRYIITVLMAIFVPFILTVTCFGKDIISMLYQRGEFTKEMSDTTAILFCIYSFGIFGYVCQELFNKILYLDSKYKYTVASAVIVVALKPVINLFAVKTGGTLAVALMTTVMFCMYAVFIFTCVGKTIGKYVNMSLIKNVSKILLSGLLALIVYFAFSLSGLSVFNSNFGFIILLGACGLVYIIALALTGSIKYIIKPNLDKAGN